MDRTGVSGKRGRCQLSFVYLGERYRIVLSGFSFEKVSDRKAAERILATVKREIELGTFYFPKHFPDHPAAGRFRKGHQITVGEALKQWLLAKRPRIEPTTYHGYEKDAVYHLIPEFGARRLSWPWPTPAATATTGLFMRRFKTSSRPGFVPAPWRSTSWLCTCVAHRWGRC